jgi:hypothetical protein
MNTKVILALFVSLAVTPVIGEIWCSTTQHPNDVPLWRKEGPAFESGNSLYDMCTTQGKWLNCAGYITGVADVLSQQNPNNMCLPKGVVISQVVDVVKKYFTEHPESRHYTAISEVTAALTEAFPCTASQ